MYSSIHTLFIPTCVLLNLLPLLVAGRWWGEEASNSGHLQETQNTKEEEAKGPQWASEASVCLCLVLQGHPSQHQGPEPQRHLRGGVKDRGLHVGWPGRGTETGRSSLFDSIWVPFCLHSNWPKPESNSTHLMWCKCAFDKKNIIFNIILICMVLNCETWVN